MQYSRAQNIGFSLLPVWALPRLNSSKSDGYMTPKLYEQPRVNTLQRQPDTPTSHAQPLSCLWTRLPAAREQVTQQWVLVSSCPAGQRGAAVVIISVFHSTWLIVRYKTKIFFNFELHGLKNERVSKRDGWLLRVEVKNFANLQITINFCSLQLKENCLRRTFCCQ